MNAVTINFVTTALWFLLAILILVPIHEFGHFYAMRRFGVKVLRFSVGFGHRIFTWRDSKGTEFAISAIPLGGYVKPLDERNEDVAEEDMPYTLSAQPVWQRLIIFAAGPVANLLLAALFFWALFVINGVSSYTPVIGKIEEGSIAQKAGLEVGQEIIAIDGEPTPTRRAVILHLLTRLGESGPIFFTTKYPDSSFTYDSEGELKDWLREAVSPDPISGLGLEFFSPPVGTTLDKVVEGSAAERAGFQSGDTLISVDNQTLEDWFAWVDYVRARPNQTLNVELERDGQMRVLALTPEALEVEGETIGRAGVSVVLPKMPEEMIKRHNYNLFSGFTEAISKTWSECGFVLLSMKKLVLGEISTKNLSGPIGIAKVAASHAEYGFWAFVSFLASLSVVLGVLNLLPIPILDGGHIVFGIVEWIKGRPVSQEVQVWSMNVGIFMLLGVMMVAFYNDIFRL